MNPIDILGGMLGRKAGGSSGGGGSLGGSILESILKGKNRGGSGGGAAVSRQRPSGSPQIRPRAEKEEFDDLEDFFRNAHKSSRQKRGQSIDFGEPANQDRIQKRQTDFSKRFEQASEPFNQKAQLLVIAMINAAKADGQIDQQEQDAIINELGDLSQDEVRFLRSEFAKPLDVQQFVQDVPVGMEKQIYAASLLSISLDRQAEADYLRQLAKGFRMTQADANAIHREFGAPEL